MIHKRISSKYFKKTGAKAYQILVQMDEIYPKYFLKWVNLISFNYFKMLTHWPITHCDNCQYYGHSQDRCRFTKPTCAYCTKNHSYSCPIQDDHQKHLSINCRNEANLDGKPLHYHHCGNSNACLLLQRRFQNINQPTI